MTDTFPNLGLRELPEDKRDFKLGAIVDLPKLSDLPERFYLGDVEPHDQIADQNDDMCSAAASAAGAGSLQDKVRFYYPFVFAASKKISGDPDEWGQDLRSIAKAWVQYGCTPEDKTPDFVRQMTPKDRRRLELYPEAMKWDALPYVKDSFATLKGPYDAYDNIRASLYARRFKIEPAVFGVRFGWSLRDYVLSGVPQGGFGHAMLAVGWDKDGIIAVNTVGKDAGKEGVHRITRDAIDAFVPRFGAVMLTDISRFEAERRIRDNQMKQLDLISRILFLLKEWAKDIMR